MARFTFKPVWLWLVIFVFIAGCGEEAVNVVEKFSASNTIITEGSSDKLAEISVSVDGTIVSPITASYTVEEGTAVFNDDIEAGNGEITFEPGVTTVSLPVQVIGDDHLELEETFNIKITYEGITTNVPCTIKDDDEAGEILSDADGFYTPAEYTSMRLIWSDEFDAAELNPEYWTYEIGDGCEQGICGWGNDELENYTDDPANSRIEDGRLVITAIENNGNYTSARIKTEDKVELQYGRIDVRAKMPKGQGIWPAIWMLGENITDVGWPACGEIDIMELVGHEPEVTHGTVHYESEGYRTSSGSRTLSQGDFSDKFHVYSLVWDRDRIIWYLDNEPFKTFTRPSSGQYPFNAPFYFIMNVAVGGRWPGNPDETTVFPQEMTVDYIRVFQ